jgi:hypothetical protein
MTQAWRRALTGPAPRRGMSTGRLAAERIGRANRRVLGQGSAVTPDSPPESLHDLTLWGPGVRQLSRQIQPDVAPEGPMSRHREGRKRITSPPLEAASSQEGDSVQRAGHRAGRLRQPALRGFAHRAARLPGPCGSPAPAVVLRVRGALPSVPLSSRWPPTMPSVWPKSTAASASSLGITRSLPGSTSASSRREIPDAIWRTFGRASARPARR